MSVTVKVYFQKGNNETEIRRFSVDQDVSCSYTYLSKKVTQVFPDLTHKPYTTLWKDPEGDYVAFSSDDELMEALGCVDDGVFRMYVRERNDAATDSVPLTSSNQPEGTSGTRANQEDVLHPGVVCDGCEQPIRGVRYKCFVCPDYDLCSQCEAKAIHREHEMMRICTPRPGLGGWMGFGFFPPPPPTWGPGPRGPFGGPPPPPPPPHNGEGHPPPPPGPHGHPPPPHHGPHGHPHGPYGHPPGPHGPCGFGPGRESQWGKWMNRSVRRFMRQMAGKDEKSQESWAEKPKTENKDADSSDEGEQSPTGDYLQDVGQRVAAMLDPLGIDVEVDVEHKGQRRRCPGGFGGPHGMPPFWGAGTWGGQCPRQNAPNASQASNSTPSDAPKKDETEAKSAQDVKMETEPDVTTEENAAPKSSEQIGDITEHIVNTTPPASETPSPENNGWTMLQNPEAPTTQRLYPDVSPPAQAPTHEDPRIAQALDHMASMGFSDDGGWLTRLVEVNNGDINRALDAIRVNKNK